MKPLDKQPVGEIRNRLLKGVLVWDYQAFLRFYGRLPIPVSTVGCVHTSRDNEIGFDLTITTNKLFTYILRNQFHYFTY